MGELQKGSKYERRAFAEVQSKSGAVRVQTWTNPLAASATRILNAHALDGTTVTTVAAQPDFPRNVQIVASGATTANVTINGTDMRGGVISETLALNGTTPVIGTRAFATIPSIVLPSVATPTINVGNGVKFGLDRLLPGANTVLCTNVDGALDGSAATVAPNASSLSSTTVQFNTAPNGTHDYLVVFVTQEITTANQSTS